MSELFLDVHGKPVKCHLCDKELTDEDLCTCKSCGHVYCKEHALTHGALFYRKAGKVPPE